MDMNLPDLQAWPVTGQPLPPLLGYGSFVENGRTSGCCGCWTAWSSPLPLGPVLYGWETFSIQRSMERWSTNPIYWPPVLLGTRMICPHTRRSEEHTSELQSRENLVCRLLLE